MPVIEAVGVSYSYGATKVLEGIDFTVEKGEYVALIGPNGGGKTTLLKILLGLLPPEQGQVSILGRKTPPKGRVGYVPQIQGSKAFDFPATVQEVVTSGQQRGRGIFGRATPSQLEGIQKAMELTGVADYRDRLLSDLSGGQRQRVFIARALAGEPELLFLDEPIAGVDIGAQERFYQLLSSLNQEQGLTLVFVSHDVGVMSKEAGKFLCLNKRLVCHEGPENFLKEEFMDQVYGKDLTPLTHRH